jgi:hypothetical protein
MAAISHHGCDSKHNMTPLLQFQDWHTSAPPHGNPKHGFVPKIEDMDLGGSNLTQLTRVDLQYEIRVHGPKLATVLKQPTSVPILSR